jgi:hypothetical protein
VTELRQYDPLKVVASWDTNTPLGVIDIVDGAASGGDFITIETDNDAWSRESDLAGNATRVRNHNDGGRIRINLSASSPTNTRLSAAAALDNTTEGVVGPIVIKDLNGNTVIECDGCFIADVPDFALGSDRGTRTWVLECAAVRPFLGGHDVA